MPARHRISAILLLIALFGAGRVFAAGPAYPLKAGANGRYLVDQNNVPFLIMGDSPQSLIGNLSTAQAAQFMTNRTRFGVNTLWVNLLCDSYTACNANGTTFDGLAPFAGTEPSNYDLSRPKAAYFARADAMLKVAETRGIVVLLDPIETGGWLETLRNNGLTKAEAYGRFLGNRYKNFKNIIWLHGNDFQSWQTPSDNALIVAVAKGIRATDPNHLQTAELSYYVSATLQDAALAPYVGLDAVYSYRPTYAQVLAEYARKAFKPIFMVEANYEFEHNGGTDGGALPNLRRQEYWTMLSGATGQLYGSSYTWRLPGGWQQHLNTRGILQFSYVKKLFGNRKWFNLVPDRYDKVFTAGRGTFSDSDPIPSDTYATAAHTADGRLAIAYLPSPRTITVDMSKFHGSITARWFDPTNGVFYRIAGSPFAATGSRGFTPKPANSAGDSDWVLVLEAP